jgi:hypothetical protein
VVEEEEEKETDLFECPIYDERGSLKIYKPSKTSENKGEFFSLCRKILYKNNTYNDLFG